MLGLIKGEATLFQRLISLATDDDVVQYIYVQKLAGLDDLPGDPNIFG